MDLANKVDLALRQIIEPRYGINIVDLGLIYHLEIDMFQVISIGLMMVDTKHMEQNPLFHQVRAKLEQVPLVQGVDIELILTPAWSRKRMNEAARKQCGLIFFGEVNE